MSERTKIKETITAGEYGDYKLVFGYDGSNWRPILINTAGKPQVVELNSGWIKTAVEKIDDLQGALKSVDTDELIVRLVTTGGVEINPAKEDGNLQTLKKYHTDEITAGMLYVTTTGQTATSSVIGAGQKIEIVGYSINITANAPTGVSGYMSFGFVTYGIYPWAAHSPTVSGLLNPTMGGLVIRGTDNEEITLTNATFTGGSVKVYLIYYYRVIAA